MQAYSIDYTTLTKVPVKGNMLVDAKDAKSAKKKIERKLKLKICVDYVSIVGYY